MKKTGYKIRCLYGTAFLIAAVLPALTACISIGGEEVGNFAGGYQGLPIRAVLPAKPGRRPIPISTVSGKGYNDLLFYERSFASTGGGGYVSPDEQFDALPEGRVIANNDTLMAATITGRNYGTATKIDVSGLPFTQGWEVTVSQTPPLTYDYQLVLPGLRGTGFRHGDAMLLVITMRTLNTGMEDGNGKIQLIVEQESPPNDKALQENVFAISGGDWFTAYLPFTARSGYTRLCLRLGFGVQTIQIGGYQIINYERQVAVDKLPSSSIMRSTDGREVFDKNYQWRRDAWARIEEIRKGDLTVIVRDAQGNAVDAAQIEASMYEHEFRWGTAIMTNILDRDSLGSRRRAGLSLLFNTCVFDNMHKWNRYEGNPELTRRMYNTVTGTLSLPYMRGHALMWDRAFPSGWVDNAVLPRRMHDMLQANNRTGLDAAIKAHFSKITGDYKGQVYVWDVVNEAMANRAIRERYGNQVLKDWFAWARTGAGPETLLFINETGLLGNNPAPVNQFKQILNYMRDNNVDFDGIGIQAHFGNNMVTPENFYNMLEDFSKEYGKIMEITEFDMGYELSSADREYESSFTRDIMIAVFSHPNMIGFTMWGFWSREHWQNNAPIFDANWNLKESGKQYIDLLYNKWWTKESGNTGADGIYNFRGFYGDYDITVAAGGKTKTVEAHFYKGKDNTITVTLE